MSTEEEAKQAKAEEQKPAEEQIVDAPVVETKMEVGVKLEEEKVKVEADEKPVGEEAPAATTTERKGIISDPSVLPESSDPDEIRKQVEFYFSDSNLRFDKFLFGLVGKDNKWVPLKMVASFKRMQRFKDFAAIQAALETSELLELNPTKIQVKRKVPLDVNVDHSKIKEIQDRAQSRSLYAKGFGEETPSTQFDIEAHFAPYGPINAVRLRRDNQKVFKGSVFVEFKDDETLEKFVALEDKPKYRDQELLYMKKKEYVDMKIQDIKEGKIQPQDKKTRFAVRKFDAFKDNGGKHHHGGSRNDNGEKGSNGPGGRGGRGRGRGRGGRGGRGRGGRGGREGGRDRDGDRVGNAGDEHSIPKVQASGEQGTKRQRDDAGDAGNEEKKTRVEA